MEARAGHNARTASSHTEAPTLSSYHVMATCENYSVKRPAKVPFHASPDLVKSTVRGRQPSSARLRVHLSSKKIRIC
eukprot:2598508-Rhodomonas_salina.2